jgi:DNA-binding transcriptional MerR regulator
MPGRRVSPTITFNPPNRGAIWTNLDLTKAQLAKLCGATTRQIGHWTNRGYLAAVRQDPERFNGDAIDMCLLIKQGLDQDLPLHRAVALARAYLNEELRRHPEAQAIAPPTLVDMLEKLKGAGASIEAVIQVVEPLASRGGPDPPGGTGH